MSNQLMTITTNEQGSFVVSSLDLATGLGVQHKNLLSTIRAYTQAIEQHFKRVAFETESFDTPGGEQTREVAYLTEDQAMFVGTLSRNSKRVVEFKSILVKSFAEARRQLTTTSPSTDLLIQTMTKQTQLLAEAQVMIDQLRADVDLIKSGGKPIHTLARPTTQLSPMSNRIDQSSNLRERIQRRISEYCTYHHAEYDQTYNYLYRRLSDVYGVNVHRLNRTEGENLLDTLERYGRLPELHKLTVNELVYPSSEPKSLPTSAPARRPTLDTMKPHELKAIIQRAFSGDESIQYGQLLANIIEASEFVGTRLGKTRAETFIRRAVMLGLLQKGWESGRKFDRYRMNVEMMSNE